MALRQNSLRFVDLTHPLHEGVPTWSGRCGFHLELRLDYEKGLRVQTMRGHCGVGTHMDAPSHFIRGGCDIDKIPLEKLFAEACVLDLRKEIRPDLKVEIAHIKAFEKAQGPIPEGAIVIAHTGWGMYWKTPEKYRNADDTGKMHFPGFSAECAEFLSKKAIAGIGIDTLSPDGSNDGFPVHLHILGAGMYILENLAALEQLPVRGSHVLSLPLPHVGATEAGARVIGVLK